MEQHAISTIRDTMTQHDPTLHSDLERVSWTILNTAKRSGLLGGPMSEKEQCLYEAGQFGVRAGELRAALRLMGGDGGDDRVEEEEEEQQQQQQQEAAAAMVEEGHAKDEGDAEEEEGGGLMGSLRSFVPRFLRGGRGAGQQGARETLRRARRYETMAACLRTQAELDLAFWPTSGQYVRPEELSLLYLARHIILCEGEKDRFVEAHPEIDRHDDVSQELEDLSKRLLRYRTLFSIRAGGRWLQTWSEDGLQVAKDARVPASRPNAFHVVCFFDGTVQEQDLQDSTEYLRVHEAEKRARWQAQQALSVVASGVAAPFRLIFWPFTYAAKKKAPETKTERQQQHEQGGQHLAKPQQGKAAAIVKISLLHLWSHVTGTIAAIFGQGWLGDDDDEEDDEEEGEEASASAAAAAATTTATPAANNKHAEFVGIPSSEAEERV